ncbi:MAG: hypothetical protein ACR2RL_09560, partial [Gammaproteobacteria bacterium]
RGAHSGAPGRGELVEPRKGGCLGEGAPADNAGGPARRRGCSCTGSFAGEPFGDAIGRSVTAFSGK